MITYTSFKRLVHVLPLLNFIYNDCFEKKIVNKNLQPILFTLTSDKFHGFKNGCESEMVQTKTAKICSE